MQQLCNLTFQLQLLQTLLLIIIQIDLHHIAGYMLLPCVADNEVKLITQLFYLKGLHQNIIDTVILNTCHDEIVHKRCCTDDVIHLYMVFLQIVQNADAVLLRHNQIQHKDIQMLAAQLIDTLLAIGGTSDDLIPVALCERFLHTVDHLHAIIHQIYIHFVIHTFPLSLLTSIIRTSVCRNSDKMSNEEKNFTKTSKK